MPAFNPPIVDVAALPRFAPRRRDSIASAPRTSLWTGSPPPASARSIAGGGPSNRPSSAGRAPSSRRRHPVERGSSSRRRSMRAFSRSWPASGGSSPPARNSGGNGGVSTRAVGLDRCTRSPIIFLASSTALPAAPGTSSAAWNRRFLSRFSARIFAGRAFAPGRGMRWLAPRPEPLEKRRHKDQFCNVLRALGRGRVSVPQ